ncbi:MAG: hypothetical protein Q7T04_03835 [Dehalococcoidia bacterium]|nr:hypothetical protein [Dehalococcoidia bacterium]
MKGSTKFWFLVAVALLAAMPLLLWLTGIWDVTRKIDTSQVIQILLTFALVLVTAFYAIRTAEIARETKKQTEATVKMVMAQTKPLLIPYLELVGDVDQERNVTFKAGVDNDGNGPAYDVEFRIQDKERNEGASQFTTGQLIPVLRAHSSAPWFIPVPRLFFPISERAVRQFLVVKYQDVDGEHEVIQPFVLTTGDKGKPIALLESISRRTLGKGKFGEAL